MSLFGNLFHRGEKIKRTDIHKRFELIGRVGQGSMSRVWKAHDHLSSRLVALKVLDREKTLRFESRFKGLNKPSEGEVALSLHHPHIVSTIEFGMTTEDEMFLVMEYIDGVSLSLLVDLQNDRMRRYRLRYMIQIGEALDYFHRRNWIHRDICPRNLLVTDTDQVKLIDFGLTVPNTPDFTKPGNRTGTASYMAPELIKRQTTDQRIDVFSYAVTCFELYTKRHPWDAAMTIDAVLQHINKPPHDINQFVKGIDQEIADTIMKGLEARPDDRWPTAADMVSIFRSAESRLVKQARAAMAARQKKKFAAKAGPAKAPAKAPTKPAAKPSAAEKPAAEKPAAEKPAAEKPAAEKPAAEKPAAAKKSPAPQSDVAADKAPAAASAEGASVAAAKPTKGDKDAAAKLPAAASKKDDTAKAAVANAAAPAKPPSKKKAPAETTGNAPEADSKPNQP